MDTDDGILLRRWLSERDADAFVQVAMRHAKMVYGVALRILGNSHDAEEVAQDCFEALASTTKPPRDNLSGWLYKVAANQAKKRIRSEQRRQDREERYLAELPTDADASWDDICRYVDEIILELPDINREPLVAHFFEQETHEIIAQRLGIPRRTVSNRIQQGIETVRHELKKRGIPVATTVMGTWFEAQATAISVPSARLTERIARIGVSGVGRTAITIGSVSLLGKVGAMLSVKWVGVGIVAALIVGSALFMGSRPPQTPEPVSAPSAPVISGKEKASPVAPVTESSEANDTVSTQSAKPAVAPVVEDPLASLWGEWFAEVKAGDEMTREIGLMIIKKENSNIVMSSDRKLILTGPINGVQLQMKQMNMSNQMVFSGTYTPNTDSFKISGSINQRGKSQSFDLVFKRLKGDDKTTLSRKAEVQAIYSAISEYKNAGGLYPDRLEAVARFFKGDAALLTSSPERKITYQPKGQDMPEAFFSEDMLQWEYREVQYADQIVAAEARLHEIGVYDYLFHPALVAIDYSNPTQRIAASSSGKIVVESDETQLPGKSAEQCAACQNNLKQLGLVEKMFSNEHRDYLSGGWATVYPEYLTDPATLSCPCRPIGDDSYEILFPAVSWDDFCLELCGKVMGGSVEVATAQSMVPMVMERSTHTKNGKQGRNVMFFDGHVEFVVINDLPQKVERFVKANK